MRRMELIAPCHFGLEAVLKKEVVDLGYEVTEVENGRVTFIGDAEAICRANIFLRTTERVLLKVGSFHAETFEDLFQGTRGGPLRQECRANLREGLSSFLAALAEKYVLTRQESSVVVDVEVEADKLKKMPEEAVQTLRLNISPVSIPSVLAEQNDVSGLSAQ